jgi:hypothetical protein
MTLLLLPSFSHFMLLRQRYHITFCLFISLSFPSTMHEISPSFSILPFSFTPSLPSPLFLHSSLSPSQSPPSNYFTYLFSFLLFQFHAKVRDLQPPLIHAKNAVRTIRRCFEKLFPLLQFRSIFILKISYVFSTIFIHYYH